MTDRAASTYDAVPYTSFPYANTHPDRLCTVGRLFGMSPAHPTSCRVLELGCAAGGNLLPMAEQLPESEFIGIDQSRRQIEEGRENIRELGLTNLRLEHADILEAGPVTGTFDYIICHGVYSWVSREVRDRILSICRDCLRPQGIGYISFNTYPGWHMRESVRCMMRYHASRFASPEERVAASRDLLGFMVDQMKGSTEPYAMLLDRELELLKNFSDDYLFHEHLESVNAPCYFHEFVEHIERYRLQFLGDADVSTMLGREIPEETRNAIERIASDIVQMEQYYDFMRNRQFRSTLICHDSMPLRRRLDAESVKDIRFLLQPSGKQEPVTLGSTEEHCFQTAHSRLIRTGTPLMKAVLEYLMKQWPKGVDVSQLYNAAKSAMETARISTPPEDEARHAIAAELLHITGNGGVALRTWEPPVALEIGQHPRMRRSSQVTARRYNFAINAHHERCTLSAAVAQLATLLDGRRDRSSLIEFMLDCAQKGRFSITVNGNSVDIRDDMRIPVSEFIDATLQKFAQSLLLM